MVVVAPPLDGVPAVRRCSMSQCFPTGRAQRGAAFPVLRVGGHPAVAHFLRYPPGSGVEHAVHVFRSVRAGSGNLQGVTIIECRVRRSSDDSDADEFFIVGDSDRVLVYCQPLVVTVMPVDEIPCGAEGYRHD